MRIAVIQLGYADDESMPERVERVTGVAADEVRALADLLAAGERVVVLTARGAEQHAQGSDTVLAWIDVALALGRLGGYLNRTRDGAPGWRTLWRGMQRLHAMAEGAALLLDAKSFG